MTIPQATLEEMIAAARGELEVDLLIEGASVANLLSGEVHGQMSPCTKAE